MANTATQVVTMKQLLESGVHFGHQTRRWNPKMKRFIFTERNGIYIIDLQQSLSYIDRAYEFVKETVAHGGSVLFIGTKKQAQEAIAEQATRVGMPYVNQRWLGGMLTNFQTVHKRLQRLKELEEIDFDDVRRLGHDQEGAAGPAPREGQADQDPRRHPRHDPGAQRGVDRRHQEGAHRRRRGPQAAASRSSRSSTPTATRTRSTTRSRATTTRSAPSRLLTRVIADAVAEGLMARVRTQTGADEKPEGLAADEPLAEWERELLQRGTAAEAARGRCREARRGAPAGRAAGRAAPAAPAEAAGRGEHRHGRRAPAEAAAPDERRPRPAPPRRAAPRPPRRRPEHRAAGRPGHPAGRRPAGRITTEPHDHRHESETDEPWRTSPPLTSRGSATPPAPG